MLGIRAMVVSQLLSVLFPVTTMGVNPNCNYSQILKMGQTYYIYNNEYPNFYGPGEECRWTAEAPYFAQIVLSCEEVNIPSSDKCVQDRLSVSLTGDSNFSDAHNYCGTGSFTLVSEKNKMSIGLHAASNSRGGEFLCTLIAIQGEITTTTQQPPPPCDCGWRFTRRIVGGMETGVNEFPMMAGLIDVQLQNLFCGSTIISSRYAVTAAHCVIRQTASNLGLLVGDHNISTRNETSATALYRVVNIIINPSFNNQTFVNDIAVVKTEIDIVFSLRVGPVCLPFRYSIDTFSGNIVEALGWGTLFFTGPRPDTLQKVNLTVLSPAQCALSVPGTTTSQMCTFGYEKDACQFDSGGPLLWQDPTTERLQLVGIISFGRACATLNPSVNTRVTSYLIWIASVTSDADYCVK